MEYRQLGSAGLKVSLLSLGSWLTFGRHVDVDSAVAKMKAAWEGMDGALKRIGLDYIDLVESKKAVYW
jgi:aryl-alcohol dehydrogenase-like predicted oxidoreductase